MRHHEAGAGATDTDEKRAPLRRRKAHVHESNEAHWWPVPEPYSRSAGSPARPPR
jgi:hypothetical protein